MANQESSNSGRYGLVRSHKGWLFALAGLVILFWAFVIGAAAGRFYSGPLSFRERGEFASRHMLTGDRLDGGFGSRIGTNHDRASGTVTAVSGSSFTLAGHGSSYSVQTDSTTNYEGSNSVKVNDTVIAFGTTNNGVLTATQVVINP